MNAAIAQKRVLLLGGSPRGEKSTSESLGNYLLSRLAESGWATDKVRIHSALKTDAGRTALLAAVSDASLVVLASPLYVDCLPAPVIAAAELLARVRAGTLAPQPKYLVAILNSGFPESQQSATALAICRRFAAQAGFEWAGGLALGAGPTIDGKPLAHAGAVARNAIKALDLTAAALAGGKPVPAEAVQWMGKPIVPARLYVFIGNRECKQKAKQNGVQDLHARPFAV